MGTLGLFPALTWCQIFLTKRKREQQNGLVPFLSHDGGVSRSYSGTSTHSDLGGE